MPIIDPFENKQSAAIIDPFEKSVVTPKAEVDEGPDIPDFLVKYPNLAGLYGAGKALLETGGEMYAMTKGAAAGAAFGLPAGPVGVVAGGLLGAGAGYMAAKGIEAKIKEPTKPLELEEMATDVAKGAAYQAAGGVVNKTLAPLAKRYAGTVNRAGENIAQKAKEVLGITLSPAEATQNKTLALWESLADKSPFSASEVSQWREINQIIPLLKAREKLLSESGSPEATASLGRKIKIETDRFLKRQGINAENEINAARDSVLKKLGSSESTEDLIKPVQELLEKKSLEAVAKKNAIYAEVGASLPKGKAIPEELSKIAEEYSKKLSKLPNQDQKLGNILGWATKKSEPSPEAVTILEQLKGMGANKQIMDDVIKKAESDGVDFGGKKVARDWETLQGLRTQLNDLIKNEDLSIKMNNPKLKGQLSREGQIYKELKASLDTDMMKAAEAGGSEASSKLEIANAFFADEYAPIWKNSKLIKQLAYKNPEEVTNIVFKPNNIQEIRKLKQVIGEKGFDNLKKSFTNKMLQSNKEQVFNQAELNKAISQHGNELLGEVYSKSEFEALKGLANKQFDKVIIGENFLKSIAEGNHEIVVDSILGTMQKTSSEKVLMNNIINIKKAVSPETMNKIRYQLADRLFQPNAMTDFLGPESTSRNIGKYKNVLSSLYSPQQMNWLDTIRSTGKRMVAAEKLAQNPSGTAQNIIAYGAFGAIVNPLLRGNFSEFLAGVGSAVLAPKIMTKIYFSPLGRKYFTEGLVTNPNTKKGIEITTKLIGIMADKNERD